MYVERPHRHLRPYAGWVLKALLVGMVAAWAAACGGNADGGGADAIRSAATPASGSLPQGVRSPTLYQIERARQILREEQEKVVPDGLAMVTFTAATLAVQACPLAAAGVTAGGRAPQQLVWDGDAKVRELVESYPLARTISHLALYPGTTTIAEFYSSYSTSKVDGGCVSLEENAIEALNSHWMLMSLFEKAMADPPESITANVNLNQAFFLALAKRRVPPDRSGFGTPEPERSPEAAVRSFLASPPPEVIEPFEWSRVFQGYEFGRVETDGRGNARVCIAAMQPYPVTQHSPEGGYATYGYYLTERPEGWEVSEITGGNFIWPMEDRPSPPPSLLWDRMDDLDCPPRPY